MTDSDNILLEQIGEFNFFLRYIFCLHKGKRNESFQLLDIQIIMRNLIFLHWVLIFLFTVMFIGRKKTNKARFPQLINPATELLLPNDSKPELSVL